MFLCFSCFLLLFVLLLLFFFLLFLVSVCSFLCLSQFSLLVFHPTPQRSNTRPITPPEGGVGRPPRRRGMDHHRKGGGGGEPPPKEEVNKWEPPPKRKEEEEGRATVTRGGGGNLLYCYSTPSKKGTAAPPTEGRARQHRPKEAEGGSATQKEREKAAHPMEGKEGQSNIQPSRARSAHLSHGPGVPGLSGVCVCARACVCACAGTTLARTHLVISADARAGRGAFPKPMPAIIPMVRFGLPKPPRHGYLQNADSDLMHHQFRLSLLQWNPGPARRNPTNTTAAASGKFHAVILQEASDHVPHISDQFIAYTGNTDLAILLIKDTLESTPAVYKFNEASTSKDTPHFPGTPTITFRSVHIHNVVAKNRDASTDLLRRLRAHMTQHNVDFIGGDFNMSACSTVVDVFVDPKFSTPGNSLLWRLGALEDSNRERTGSLIMPKRSYEWYVDAHGCYKFNNADLALGPRDTTAHFPAFLHLRTTNFPGPDSIRSSDQARQKSLERKATQHERSTMPQQTHPASSFQTCQSRRCKKTQRVRSPCRGSSLWCTSLLGLIHAFNMGSMKQQVRAMLHNKIT